MRNLALALALSLVSGCFMQNQSAAARLGDSVYDLAEETRWGRTQLAAERVVPDYRHDFLASRRKWGRDYQIGDCDIHHMQLAEDSDSASVVVVFNWYDRRSMEVSETTVQQEWLREGRVFVLKSEEVLDGNPALIALPPRAPGQSAERESSSVDG